MPDLQARLLVFFLKLFSLLPLGLTRRLGVWVGVLLWLFNGRARSTTQINIQLCYPELDKHSQEKLTKQSLQGSCITAFEMGPSWFWPKDKILGKISSSRGTELLQQAVESGQGVIVLAPHIGNWELLGLCIAEHYPITNLFQPPKSAYMGEMIRSARTRSGSHLAPTNRKGIITLLKALKAGEVVGILPDQEPEPESGVFAPFFGVDALTMTLASNLARKTGARVLCGFTKRINADNYELVFIAADEGIGEKDRLISASALNRSVENCVKQAREQYQWEYKRFKRRPNNEPRYYPKGK